VQSGEVQLYQMSVHILDKTSKVFQISDCFYKDMPVEHVEDRLTANGDFLLRNIRDTLHMVLSVFWGGKVGGGGTNALLHPSFRYCTLNHPAVGTWQYSVDGKAEFVTVSELVVNHYTNKVSLPNGIQLLRPIKTPNFKYAEGDVYIIKKIGQGAFGEV